MEAQLLQSLIADARAAWPSVGLGDQAFADHLDQVAPEDDDPAAALRRLHTRDLFLACACAHGDAAALRAFEARIMPGAERAVARVDPAPAFVEEICSDVRVRLLTDDDGPARITRYLGHGPLLHWVQVTAMRLAQSKKRSDKRARFTALDDIAASGTDVELAPLAAQLREPFGAAFNEALAELSPRERNVLRMYLVDDISADKIGTMYRVHRATVARWIAAARRKVYVGTRKRMSQHAGIAQSSFDSLMGQVLSGMDISLATFLDE